MPDQKTDGLFLRQALDLARQGVSLTSPNPCVGAVVVDQHGSIVGTGSHIYDEVKHAEVLALQEAGERARGATLYINLEPCSHTGRTGPCADTVITAGIRRVVASMADPNPLVAGAGFARLRSAGIEVEIGGFETEARKLNEAFARYTRDGVPFVTLKAAMTLDGKIAPPGEERRPGTQVYITGEESRAHAQELRHQNDAIMVGVGTVIADDPLLTDRSGKPRRRPLLRVLLDSRLRLSLESRLVQTAKDDLLVLCSFAEEKKKRELLKRGVQVEQIPQPTPEGHPDLQAVVRYLGKRQITSLMIEGGAMVNWASLSSGIVDKIFFYYTPKILGSKSVPVVAGSGRSEITDDLHLRSLELHRFGEDFAVEGYLRNPYSS